MAIIKEHETQLKKVLNVESKVYYGKEAKEKMLKYRDEVSKKFTGYYYPPEDEIYIFKIDRFTIGTLAHELRHADQYNNKNEEFIFFKNWHKKDPHYSCRETELNANSYSLKYCKENKLGWRVTSRYSRKIFVMRLRRLLHKLIPGHICP